LKKFSICILVIFCLFSGIISGYYIGYIKYVPKIENYEKQISILNLIVSNKEEEIFILQRNLTEAKNIISNYEGQISNLQSEKHTLELKLINYEKQINLLKLYLIRANDTILKYEKQLIFLKAKVNECETQIENYEKQISELKMIVQNLQSHTLYRNPTYKEVKDFIEKDKTNENKYIPGKYVCIDFAKDVNNNAEKEGIRTALVIVYFKNGTHALVAFETIDKGLVFIEPQADKEVKVEIGIRYWVDNGFGKPDYDDTITKILIIW
jgi:predicted RNase H-like nuclease (RuvC/YqgF family)